MKTEYKKITIKALKGSILFITIYSILMHTKYITLDSIFANTAIWWMISALILTSIFVSIIYFYDKNNNKRMVFVLLYLLWNIICIIRGAFAAEIYWDWKALIGNAMILMLPAIAYSATNLILTQTLLSFYVKFVLPLFILFAFIINTDAWGFYLMPMSLLLLFIPALTNKQRMLLLLVVVVVILSDTAARSNILKFTVPILMLMFYYLRNTILIKTLEAVRITLFIAPIILLILGVTGLFNIFKIQDYLKNDITVVGNDWDGERKELSMTEDTRTFLYEEVLQSAKRNDYILFGRTPARGNDSMTFGLIEFEWTGRYERLTNEIGVANVFTWTGLVGVIIYFLMFYQAAYLAVNRSNNIFAKILGVYLSFRWLWSWVEDYNTFSINYLMIFIIIGLCISDSFRKRSDKEIMIWARGIFDMRYIHFQNFLIKKSLYEKS